MVNCKGCMFILNPIASDPCNKCINCDLWIPNNTMKVVNMYINKVIETRKV